MSYSERGSKIAVSQSCDQRLPTIQHDHRTVCLLVRSMFTNQPIKVRHEIKRHGAKTCLLQALISSSFTTSAQIKNPTVKCDLSSSFCLPLAHTDEVVFFYCNVRRIVAKFIRSMSHSVTCSDLIYLVI